MNDTSLMSHSDPYNLERFLEAQKSTYHSVVRELVGSNKTGHWMWFIFPQIAGLSRSSTAQHYAIKSLDEAKAYLDHPVLGPRLLNCLGMVLWSSSSPEEIFGMLDATKLRSCLTLFATVETDSVHFKNAVKKLFGSEDPMTLAIIEAAE